MTSFDFSPKTNIALRRFLLIVGIVAAAIIYPVVVFEGAILLGSAQSFGLILVGLAFVLASLPMVVAVIVRRSVKPLVRVYQPVALAGLPLVVIPFEMILVLAIGGGWLCAHWLLVEFRLWGTPAPKDPKPEKTPKTRKPIKRYIETDQGITEVHSGKTERGATT